MNDISHEDEYAQNRRIFELKKEMHEASRGEGKIRNLGPLSALSPEASWVGKISLDERITSGELTKSKVDHTVESLKDFYAPTKSGSRIRCIDGRSLSGYDDSSVEWILKDLGPQVPGGTPAQAMCYRMAISGSSDLNEQILADDIRLMSKLETATGFMAGNHSDSKNFNSNNDRTGCGAVDSTLTQLEMVKQGDVVGVKQLTSQLMGGEFDSATYDYVAETAAILYGDHDRYFLKNADLFKELENENPDAIAVLEGSHNEVFMCINNVAGTTFNRDHFSSSHDKIIQAFNYDVWYEHKVAEAISEDKSVQSRFLHARIATAVATLMVLTDGTPKLLIREPQNLLN